VYDFSAVGYFFGRELLKSLSVPIGMINSSGGSVAEAWMARETLTSDREFNPILDREKQLLESYPKIFQNFQEQFAQWQLTSESAETPTPMGPRLGFVGVM